MQVGFINLSKDPVFTLAAVEEIADALQEQSFSDVAPFRQTAGVTCRYYPMASAKVNVASGKVATFGLPPGTSPHLILDNPSDQGELGDHYVTEEGLPILRSFWGPTKDNGGTLLDDFSVTASHEHIEASEDPYANDWIDWVDGKTEEADEACDRVEAYSYKRTGSRVSVSNFTSPRFKRPGPGPYDFMGVLSAWDELPANCYRIVRVGGPQGVTTPQFGRQYPDWKKALKMLPTSKATRRGVVWIVESEVADLAVDVTRTTEPPRT